MKRWGIFWKEKCSDISRELDVFFENLYSCSLSENITSSIQLTYREGQHNYALDIMDAIKKQAILLIEGGVGIGKSYGYLLPIFYTYKNEPAFDRILISTSSITLQEQLIKDIQNVSKMLGVDVRVGIIKGINNYACLSEIHSFLECSKADEKSKQMVKDLLRDLKLKKTSDKVELVQVSKDVWEQIKLKNRGACSHCFYSNSCPYFKSLEEIKKFNIMVTNHGNLAKNIIDKTDLMDDLDMIVFDESHKILENIQSVRENELQLDSIKKLIRDISLVLDGYGISALIMAIEKLFSSARASASKNYHVTNEQRGTIGKYSVIESKRLAYRITPTVKNWLFVVLEELDKLASKIIEYKRAIRIDLEKEINMDRRKQLNCKEFIISKDLDKVRHLIEVFEDMKKGVESSNIYWASFYENNKITIRYIPKDNTYILNAIFSKNIPIVLTSATMSAYANYQPIFDGLQINKIDNRYRGIITGEAQSSPYNYDDNTLFYYDTSMIEPNESDEYIKELALKIDELIRITEGKALVLFTSKNTMNRVYELLLNSEEYPFDLLLQTDNNTNKIREKFADDTNSCLFATGVFWEGIDIKGASLSNVIITRLPFDQVDAVTQYEASKFVKSEQMKQVYLPKMLTKLEQGVGRLIRSDDDTGIVCCLDSRITKYLEDVKQAVPMTVFTDDINRVYEFSDNNITSRDKNDSKTLIKNI